MKTQRCKGSRDLLPEDMARFRYIEGVFRTCCLEWGYQEIRTPTLEYLHLFTSTGTLTPSMLNKVYSFLDWDGWSGERVVLRPEGTIPAARLYIENMLSVHPAKLFYVENVFSFEETGKESRERWQCGAEIIGSAKPSADVELMLLALETLSKLGIRGVELHLSHAGLIRALLRELGLTPVEQNQVFDRILDGDTEAVKKMMSANPQLRDSLPLLFELKGKSHGFLQNLKTSLVKVFPNLEASMEDFVAIAQLLSELGCEYQIDIASGKGFEYYTGVIFRLYLERQEVGGGGRYNDLIPLLGGGDISASGFALHADRFMDFIEDWQDTTPRVLIRSEVNTAKGEKVCFEVAGLLRQAGYVAELDQGYKGESEHQWVLSIQGTEEKPVFLLLEQASGKIVKASSPTEILGTLQAANANKASPS
jgi:histidyl-tRNA synthetase